MFTFNADQEIYEVNGVKFGGQPGEYPTVLVGSMFYEGDSILNDPQTGDFDESEAEAAITKIEELSDQTGNPAAIDTIGDSPEALIAHVDFVSEVTDLPILMDGPTPTIRAAAAEHVGDVGIENQVIYNSIEPTSSEVDKEIAAIRNAGIEAAVLLSLDTKDLTIRGRFDALKKNLTIADRAEITKPLIDPGVIDIPESGYGAKIIYEMKNEYGFPAGCSPHNEVVRWEMDDPLTENSKQLRRAVANSVIVHLGADFNLYGSVHRAPEMYEVVSTADAYVAYGAQMGERRQIASDHPLYRIFRKG